MFEFLLPDIGEGISEAELISWSVQPGDQIEEDQELATISTDKVNVELPSPRAGTVKELCWEPGDIVKVGAVFVRIETSTSTDTNAVRPKQSDAQAHETAPPTSLVTPSDDRSTVTGDHPVAVAPSTRRLAQQLGIDLLTVVGSGPDGRILRSDLESMAAANRPPESVLAPSEAPSGIRSAMAERMAYSVHTLAHSTMSFEVPADGLLAVRDRMSSAALAGDIKISMSVILAKCVAVALTRHARFNATIDEEARGLVLHGEVNLGLALASAQGLSVPVLRDVQNKGLSELARDVSDVVARGHSGQLKIEDYRGGTFTLSNTGNLEQAAILSARPVINAPQTAILWVSKIKTRPRVIDERLEAGPMLNCSLSFDHRFIDGADSVAFINDLSRVFQEPNQAQHSGLESP
jgi:pyruvate/2-oxoglutarate dehydrogenase complex dihydrolipoamide acyltransferase (E2) component